MDIDQAITALKAITSVVNAIPVAGTGLAAMLEVATQICEAAEVRPTMIMDQLPVFTNLIQKILVESKS